MAICGVPELVRTVRDKRCHIGWGMLLSWYIGEILVFIHILTGIKDKALLTNYFFNIAIISIMLYYKIRGNYEFNK